MEIPIFAVEIVKIPSKLAISAQLSAAVRIRILISRLEIVHTLVTSKWLIIRIFRHGLPPVVAAAFSLSA
jgi:hypothetical protein